jgi:phage-related protein
MGEGFGQVMPRGLNESARKLKIESAKSWSK